MTRTVLTVIGVLLAVWLAMTVIGTIVSMLKSFLFLGFVVLVIMGVIAMLGRLAGKN